MQVVTIHIEPAWNLPRLQNTVALGAIQRPLAGRCFCLEKRSLPVTNGDSLAWPKRKAEPIVSHLSDRRTCTEGPPYSGHQEDGRQRTFSIKHEVQRSIFKRWQAFCPARDADKATLLQALFSIRSERQLCEQIKYNMMFRWFLDLKPADKVWNHSTFTKNRDRFADNGLMQAFFDGTVARAIQEDATSDEHFSVDGTLIQAYGSTKSFRPKDEQDDDSQDPPDSNGWADFKGEKRSNKTHQSTTDPDSRLLKKGKSKEAKLCHMGNALMENRNSIIMGIEVNEANGYAERDAAISMLKQRKWTHKRPERSRCNAAHCGSIRP